MAGAIAASGKKGTDVNLSTAFLTPQAKMKQILNDLKEHPALMRKAMAFAIEDTAEIMKQKQIEEMKRVFDNPRPYTLNALYVKKPRGDTMEQQLKAGIAFREFGVKGTPAYKYLMPNIIGGPRRQKRSERALSGTGVLPADSWTMQGTRYPIYLYV